MTPVKLFSTAIIWCCILFSLTNGQPVSNRGVFVLNFMDLSKDRDVTAIQTINISSFVDTRIQLSIPGANINNIINLDGSNNREHDVAFTKDFGVVTGRHVTRSGGVARSAQGKPIWVHVNKMEKGTTAGYLALPLTQESNLFFTASYTVGAGSSFHSGFSIAGLQDGTCIEVYLVKGDSYTRIDQIHLDNADIYQNFDNQNNQDYTGVMINSTRPIAVYSGHECAKIPVGVNYCDAITEQLPPVSEWGQSFIIGPIAGRTQTSAGYEYRVIASDNNVVVEYKGSEGTSGTSTINRGEFVSLATTISTATVVIECSKKCMVAQYNKGRSAVSNENTPTDPYMVIVPPLDHYESAAGTIRLVTMHYLENDVVTEASNYVTIVTKSSDVNSVRLDGQPLSVTSSLEVAWTEVTHNTAYSTVAVSLSDGYHSLSSTADFTAFVYGHGTTNTAYGYTATYKINGAPVIDDSLYQIVEETTQATVQAPWIFGNWTNDFSTNELPQYGIRFAGNFSITDRQGKMIEAVCSLGYRDFFVKKRLESMTRNLTARIGSLCPGLAGSTVELTSSDTFYTKYTFGTFSFILTIKGSTSSTFRQVSSCSRELQRHVNRLENWPSVKTTVNGVETQHTTTTKSNFLHKDGDLMADCDAIELGILSRHSNFSVLREAWICNGMTPMDILVLIGGASSIAHMGILQITCTLLLCLVTIYNY